MKKDVKIEILSIGNEILMGITANTNASWISLEINKLGGTVDRHTVIGDNINGIAKVVEDIISRKAQIVIVTGGLGPTYDDVTLEGIARALHTELKLNKEALDQVKKKYEEHQKDRIKDIKLTPARIKMAILPIGSVPIDNPVGTAPAVLNHKENTLIFCLPGVPQEMKEIFAGSIAPRIKKIITDQYVAEEKIEVLGIGESLLAPVLDKILANHYNVYVKSHPRESEFNKPRLGIHVQVRRDDFNQANTIVENVITDITLEVVKIGGKVIE